MVNLLDTVSRHQGMDSLKAMGNHRLRGTVSQRRTGGNRLHTVSLPHTASQHHTAKSPHSKATDSRINNRPKPIPFAACSTSQTKTAVGELTPRNSNSH